MSSLIVGWNVVESGKSGIVSECEYVEFEEEDIRIMNISGKFSNKMVYWRRSQCINCVAD